MNKKIPLGVALALILVAAILTVVISIPISLRHFNNQMDALAERQTLFDLITVIDKEVRNQYVGAINEKDLNNALAQGYISGLGDPYAAFLTDAEQKREADRLNGIGTDFGIEIAARADGAIEITKVHSGSKAAGKGLVKGDVLTSVNDEAVTASQLTAIRSTLMTSGKVQLVIARGETQHAFELDSDIYNLTSVESRVIDSVGYIRITGFYSNTPDQLKRELSALEAQGGIAGIVFDLRFNDGGTVDSMRNCLGYLIKRGTFAHTVNKSGAQTALDSDGSREFNFSAVTLVNDQTAGEAEVFAASLNRFHNAQIVGETTKGRSLIQKMMSVSHDGLYIKLSVAKYQLVGGSDFEKTGLTPNYEVAMTSAEKNAFAFLSDAEDRQLQTGLNLMLGTSPQPSATTTAPETTTTRTDGTEASGSEASETSGTQAAS